MSNTKSIRTKKKNARTLRAVLAVIGVIVIALAAGYIGAGLRGGSATAGGGAAAPGSFIAKLKERGELRVGVAISPPITAEQPDGTLGGPNLIPLQNLADQLGVELVPVPADWGNIVAGLQAGRYDFAAYLDSTLERATSIQFTDDLLSYQGVWVVPADSPFTSSEDILASGQPIATAQGTAYTVALESLGYPLLELEDFPSALTAMKAGRGAAEFTDLPTAVGQAQADPSVKIIVPDPIIYQAGAAYGVPEDIDARSLGLINVAIRDAQDSGELTAGLLDVGYLDIDNLGDLEKK
jgi:ABC-type amino acid transport substrate-binding protein